MDAIGAFFSDGVFDNGYMWVFDNFIQAVCRIKPESGEMEIVSCYDGKEKFNAERIFLFQGKLYLIMKRSTKILIYDGQFEMYESPGITLWTEAVAYDGCIYFICRDGGIVCFDVSAKQYFEKSLLTSSEKNKMGVGDSFVRRPWVHDGTIWLAIYDTNFYLRYDMADEKADLFRTEDTDAALDRICFDGERVWLTELKQGDIICQGKTTARIPIGQSCSKFCDLDRWIAVFPKLGQGHQLFLIEKETQEITAIDLPFDGERIQKAGNCREYKDCFFLFQDDVRSLYVLHKETRIFRSVTLKCDHYPAERCSITEKKQLTEDEYIGLGQLLQFCGRNEPFAQQHDKNRTGKAIWKTVTGK